MDHKFTLIIKVYCKTGFLTDKHIPVTNNTTLGDIPKVLYGIFAGGSSNMFLFKDKIHIKPNDKTIVNEKDKLIIVCTHF